jgi:hypothetical protein
MQAYDATDALPPNREEKRMVVCSMVAGKEGKD